MISEKITEEVLNLIKAKYPIIYLVSFEEKRVEEWLKTEVADKLEKKKIVFSWTLTKGFVNLNNPDQQVDPSTADPIIALDYILKSKDSIIFLMKDFHPFLVDNKFNVIRKLRDVAEAIPPSPKSLIILSPVLKIPVELEKDITVIDFPLPNLMELENILDRIILKYQNNPNVKISLPKESQERESILKAMLGLTKIEAENILSKALIEDNKLDAKDITLVISEKKQIIRKSGIMEYYEAEEEISKDVGGLEVLKDWLIKRQYNFTEEAKLFGAPEPKGILLLGVQGCGKSLTAKAISNTWNKPLLRFDIGKVFGKYVGESEEGIRRAIKTAESVAPCILWIDEIEKGFAGTTGSGSTDSGVTARVFGTFLTWMQEKTKPVFVIATTNNISNLPPELLRKGRFDEIFFIDLPTKDERKEILKIHLSKKNRNPGKFDLDLLASYSGGFSGAELEQAISDAITEVFTEIKERGNSKRDITTDDILRNIKNTIPLSTTMKEDIEHLREWAKNRARRASKSEEYVPIPTGGERKLEI